MAGVSLDDEKSWPDDPAALEKLAAVGAVETDEGESEGEGVPVEGEAKASAEPKDAVKTPAQEPDVAAPAPTPPNASEPEPDAGAPISAADGKNIIPYHVLSDTRAQLRETQQQLRDLQAQLATAKAAPPTAQQPPLQPAVAELSPTQQAHLAKVREDWGDDLADQMERTWRLEAHVAQQAAVVESLQQHIARTAKQQEYHEQTEVEDAIAASPKLYAWSTAEDATWFNRATKLHTVLMDQDSAYARLSWMERMAALPARVEATFGTAAPTPTPTPTPTPMTKPVRPADPAAAQAKVAAVRDQPPKSLSDLSSGSTPEVSELDKLEDLNGVKLISYMNKLSSDPRRFEAYLRGLG